MQNAGLEEAQAGIKIANNLRYADDTPLMAESKEERKSLLVKVKEEGEKVGSKFNIQKTKIMASGLIQFSSVAQSCLTLCNHRTCSAPGLPVITNSRSLLRLTSIESVMPSSHLILCRPVLLTPILPSIRLFSNESTLCMRWPKDWSFSFSIIPSKEIPGLISFRMEWLNLFAVQGNLKSLLQHHSSKASVLQSSAFFTVQVSQYVTLIEGP